MADHLDLRSDGKAPVTEQIGTEHRATPLGGAEKSCRHAQQRGFSGAVAAVDADDFTGLDGEVEVPQDGGVTDVKTKPVELDDGLGTCHRGECR